MARLAVPGGTGRVAAVRTHLGVCLVMEIGLALVLRLAITAPHLSEAI